LSILRSLERVICTEMHLSVSISKSLGKIIFTAIIALLVLNISQDLMHSIVNDYNLPVVLIR